MEDKIKQAKQILQGFSNLLLSKVNLTSDELNELGQKRLDICKVCPVFNTNKSICSSCGCYMPAKTKVENAECPEKHW